MTAVVGGGGGVFVPLGLRARLDSFALDHQLSASTAGCYAFFLFAFLPWCIASHRLLIFSLLARRSRPPSS